VHLHYEFPLQGMRFRVAYTGVLGLGLRMAHVYYEFVVQGVRFRVVAKGVIG
jgi:hypothetical protein